MLSLHAGGCGMPPHAAAAQASGSSGGPSSLDLSSWYASSPVHVPYHRYGSVARGIDYDHPGPMSSPPSSSSSSMNGYRHDIGSGCGKYDLPTTTRLSANNQYGGEGCRDDIYGGYMTSPRSDGPALTSVNNNNSHNNNNNIIPKPSPSPPHHMMTPPSNPHHMTQDVVGGYYGGNKRFTDAMMMSNHHVAQRFSSHHVTGTSGGGEGFSSSPSGDGESMLDQLSGCGRVGGDLRAAGGVGSLPPSGRVCSADQGGNGGVIPSPTSSMHHHNPHNIYSSVYASHMNGGGGGGGGGSMSALGAGCGGRTGSNPISGLHGHAHHHFTSGGGGMPGVTMLGNLSPSSLAALSGAQQVGGGVGGCGIHCELDCDPRELEAFAEHFKQRRIKLGATQADVGSALGKLKLPGVGSLSQSTICRFESLTLSHNNMLALQPVLSAWLGEAERAAGESRLREAMANGGLGGLDKKRKRTSIAAPEKRSLEAYFSIQPRPSGEKIAQIADKLDLRKNVVRVWFCNQRQKQKRMKFSATGLQGSSQH